MRRADTIYWILTGLAAATLPLTVVMTSALIRFIFNTAFRQSGSNPSLLRERSLGRLDMN